MLAKNGPVQKRFIDCVSENFPVRSEFGRTGPNHRKGRIAKMIDKGRLTKLSVKALEDAIMGCSMELRCAEIWDPEVDGPVPEDCQSKEEIMADLKELTAELKARERRKMI
jgi:hypothetical protein